MAGFLEVPPRNVTVEGSPVEITTTARLFYNLRPAATDATSRPIVFLFNGYAAEIVRAFGTGPTGVGPSGIVEANPSPLTEAVNLVYLDPRQSGYSYDIPPPGASATPTPATCSPDIFNEYVDAADVLYAALTFLEDHPELVGPVYWMGESYAGVRITWILTYLRGRWDLVPYVDPSLATKIAASRRSASLYAGQILLEAWLAGGPEATAIQAACVDPTQAAAVATTAGESCAGAGACQCATNLGLSLYNFAYTDGFETKRETEAITAHIDPTQAAALLGMPLTSIAELAPRERGKGFKCSPADATIPTEAALVAALGPLPDGQVYYLDYSPLMQGKETVQTTRDWQTTPSEALAFVDNLRDVPSLLTRGAHDLVVPTLALAPALRAVIGSARVDTSRSNALGVVYPDGERFIDIRDYADAGHMVTMTAPTEFAADLEAWLAAR